MGARTVFLLLVMLGTNWHAHGRHFATLYKNAREPYVSEVFGNQNVCFLCEEFTSQALDYLAANKTQTQIVEILHQSCSRVPTKYTDQCLTLVDYYAPMLFLQVSSIQPGEFCEKVNLCSEIALISAKLKEDRCEVCHRAVSEVMEKLKDPDTQLDIIETLLKLCNSMEKTYVKKCKRIVFEYGPLALANAEQFLESKDLCATLHACDLPPPPLITDKKVVSVEEVVVPGGLAQA